MENNKQINEMISIRGLLRTAIIGYIMGHYFYQYDPQLSGFILHALHAFIHIDKFYAAYQNYQASLNVELLLDTTLQIEAPRVYSELLPTLGYDFLSQFNEEELLLFYLQANEYNIELSLEAILTNASIHSLGISYLLIGYLTNRKLTLSITNRKLPRSLQKCKLQWSLTNWKLDYFFLVKLQKWVENSIYTENVLTHFLNYHLKLVKIVLFLKLRLRKIFTPRLKKWKIC